MNPTTDRRVAASDEICECMRRVFDAHLRAGRACGGYPEEALRQLRAAVAEMRANAQAALDLVGSADPCLLPVAAGARAVLEWVAPVADSRSARTLGWYPDALRAADAACAVWRTRRQAEESAQAQASPTGQPIKLNASQEAGLRLVQELGPITVSGLVREFNKRKIRTIGGKNWKLDSLRDNVVRPLRDRCLIEESQEKNRSGWIATHHGMTALSAR